jgi:SAM-dependent methyltransferase
MDADGTWLDVGCANGHLLVTLPAWASKRGIAIEPHGLELLPRVADLARSLHPELADSIWTGSVMAWAPPRRFRYVTATDDVVPPDRLGDLVERLLGRFVSPGGRLILSSYTSPGRPPRPLFDDLVKVGHPPDGVIRIDRPRRSPLLTAWIERQERVPGLC